MENNGNDGLRVGTYFRLTLGSRKMIGCMDIGLATLQDMLGPGRKCKDVWILGWYIMWIGGISEDIEWLFLWWC